VATSTKNKNIDKKAVHSDAELLAGMVLTPLYKNPNGIQSLTKMVTSSQDPADALAHSLFILMSQARNAAMKSKLPISNKAWLANGGAVDKVIIDVGGLLASTAGPQFVDKKFGMNVKADLIKIMHDEEVSAGGKGDPSHPDNQPQEDDEMPAGGDENAPPMAPEGQGLAAPQGPPSDEEEMG